MLKIDDRRFAFVGEDADVIDIRVALLPEIDD